MSPPSLSPSVAPKAAKDITHITFFTLGNNLECSLMSHILTFTFDCDLNEKSKYDQKETKWWFFMEN
jgi:hypothetical protein